MTPLVMVHGFMGGSDQWNRQAALGDERALICVDLPGFGRNAHLPAPKRIEDFASWVLEDVARRGVTQFHLLGHSMGGMVVQEMVRQAPDAVQKLILYGTGARGVLPERFEPIETSMQRAREDGAPTTARWIAATWFRAGERAEGYAHCAAIAERSGLPAILAGLEAMRIWSGLEHLGAIGQHSLILWGDGDRTYGWPQIETLWQRIPNCNLAVLPGCAHAVHAENAELFNRLIADFLRPSPV